MSERVRIVASGADADRRRPRWAVRAEVLLLLLLGALVGRLTAPGHHDRAPVGTTAPRPGGQPARHVGSVPVGYPRTRAGAVAATLNAGALLSDPRILLDRGRRSRVLALVGTSRYAATFRGAGAAALDRARQGPLGRGLSGGAQTISLASPLSYRVVAYDGNTATIRSWGVAVVGNDQGLTPAASWATTTTTVRWQDGDWKIDAARSSDGPTPGLGAARPTDAAGFIGALHDQAGVHHEP